MGGDEGLSWRDQLSKVRGKVVELEKRREVEKRLERERNEEALARRLKQDTPEALAQRFSESHRNFDYNARRFYPLPQLEKVSEEITEFADLLNFYTDCIKSFPRVFSPAHKAAFASLLADIAELRRGLDRQLGQWREIKAALDALQFRRRKPSDDAALVAAAKSFSDRAHKVPLSIPSDFFSRETDNFWVADCQGTPTGYMKYWPQEKVLTFALECGEKVNFTKYVRGVLYKFCAQGPLSEPLPVARVRIGFVREVKFFTDMGFVRAETKGPTDWIYQREVN